MKTPDFNFNNTRCSTRTYVHMYYEYDLKAYRGSFISDVAIRLPVVLPITILTLPSRQAVDEVLPADVLVGDDGVDGGLRALPSALARQPGKNVEEEGEAALGIAEDLGPHHA